MSVLTQTNEGEKGGQRCSSVSNHSGRSTPVSFSSPFRPPSIRRFLGRHHFHRDQAPQTEKARQCPPQDYQMALEEKERSMAYGRSLNLQVPSLLAVICLPTIPRLRLNTFSPKILGILYAQSRPPKVRPYTHATFVVLDNTFHFVRLPFPPSHPHIGDLLQAVQVALPISCPRIPVSLHPQYLH